MIDAGFASSVEIIRVPQSELNNMPPDEWALFQRLISEAVAYPHMVIESSIDQSIAHYGDILLRIVHRVPSVTTLGDVQLMSEDDETRVYSEYDEQEYKRQYEGVFDEAAHYFRTGKLFPNGERGHFTWFL